MSIINLSGGRFVAGKDSANKFATYADDTNGGYLLFNDTANTRTSLTLVGSASAGTNSPAAIFFGNTNSTDTTNLQRVASIRTLRNTNNQSADLVFETNSSGTLAEKMRLDSAGSLTVGPTTGSGLTHTVDSGASTILSISSRSSNTSKLQFTINGTRQTSIEVANTASFSFRNSSSTETMLLADSGACTIGPSAFTGVQSANGTLKATLGGGTGANAGSGIVLSSLGRSVAASGSYVISAPQGSYMGLLAVSGSRSGNGNVQTQKFFLAYNPGNGTTQLTSIGVDKNGSSGSHAYTVVTSAGSASITVTNSDGVNAMDLAYYLVSLPTQ